MSILRGKPRGRNGGRPRALTQQQWRELGRHAYRLKHGKPFTEFELRASEDDPGSESSAAAKAIIDKRWDALGHDEDGDIRLAALDAAMAAIARYAPNLKQSDFRQVARSPRKRQLHEQDVEPVLHASRHWVRECIIWVAEHYHVHIKGDTVRRSERDYREWVETWERLSND
jgi:hypothetical protein